jgi:hypothetical protein
LKNIFGSKDNDKDNKDDKGGCGERKFKFVTKQPTIKTCPYCGYNLDVIPKRKKKCPKCDKDIFISQGKLYTKEEKEIRDWLSREQGLGITRKMFNEEREKLSEQFGSIASINDTAWRILNIINTPSKSYQDRKFIYMAMEHILSIENKDTKSMRVEVNRMELLHIKDEGFKKVKICTYGGLIDDFVCDECERLSKMVFTIDEALKTMPIPNRCKNERCRCSYDAFLD